MIAWLSSAFAAILNAIVAAFTFLESIVVGIIQLIVMLPNAISLLSYSITMIPPVLMVFATAFVSVSVVYLIIGR